MTVNPYTFEQVAVMIQTALQTDSTLQTYLDVRNVVISSARERDTVPTFKDYLVKISANESGFLKKVPRIGDHYCNNYYVSIELWVKASGKLANRLLSGNISKQKGIYEFFQDVSNCLEHNTFSNQLDSYPGSSIGNPVTLLSTQELEEGIGFLWSGNQNSNK